MPAGVAPEMKTDRFVVLDDLVVNLDTGAVVGPFGQEHLTPKELAAFCYLHQRRGSPVARAELMENVWGYTSQVKTRTVDITLGRLRRKLQPHPSSTPLIATIYGFGYRMEGQGGSQAVELLEAEAPPVDLPGRNRTWFGNEEELDKLTKLAVEHRRLFLVGPLGSGKSRLALEIARRAAWNPLWVSFEDELSSEAMGARILTVLDLAAQSTREMLGALWSLPEDAVVVLDGLGALDERALMLLEVVCSAEKGPAILLTSRYGHSFRSAREHRMERLDFDMAVALFVEELEYHRPGLCTGKEDVGEEWIDATDGLPGAVIHAARQVESRFQLEVGPQTVDFEPFNRDVFGALQRSVGLRPMAVELGQFPDGVRWSEARQLWPDKLADLAQLVGLGLALEDREGSLRIARAVERLVGEELGGDALVRWAVNVPEEAELRSRKHNLYAALEQAEDLDERRSIVLKLSHLLRRFGELREALALLDREVSAPCTLSRFCSRIYAERGELQLTLGHPGAAATDFRTTLRFLGDADGGERAVVSACLANALSWGTESNEVDALLASARAASVDDWFRGRVELHSALCRVRQGRCEDVLVHVKAGLRALAERPTDSVRIRLCIVRATALSSLGRSEVALEAYRDAVRVAEGSGEVFLGGIALLGWGCAELARENPEEGLRLLRQAAQQVANSESHQGLALCNTGFALIQLDRLDEAEHDLQRALRLGETVGAHRIAGVAMGNLAMVFHRRGQLEVACDHYRRAIAMLEGSDEVLAYGLHLFNVLAAHQAGRVEPPLPVPGRDGCWYEFVDVREYVVALQKGEEAQEVTTAYGRLAVRFSGGPPTELR